MPYADCQRKILYWNANVNPRGRVGSCCALIGVQANVCCVSQFRDNSLSLSGGLSWDGSQGANLNCLLGGLLASLVLAWLADRPGLKLSPRPGHAQMGLARSSLSAKP